MKPISPKSRRSVEETFDALVEARARAALCRAFIKLTDEHFFGLLAAAHLLDVSPSMMSGKRSLVRRYLDGGVDALMLTKRASHSSRITRATGPLKAGFDLYYGDRFLAGISEENEGET